MRFPYLLPRLLLFPVLALAAPPASRAAQIEDLPVLPPPHELFVRADWLITDFPAPAAVYRNAAATELILDNGLVRRTFRVSPDLATVGLSNLMTGASVLRGVKPEALLTLDGKEIPVGGLLGQPDYAYLTPAWIEALARDESAFHFRSFEVGPAEAPFEWKRSRQSENRPWPPKGARLTLTFDPPAGRWPGLSLEIVHEIYDGIPLLGKWFTLRNAGAAPVELNSFTSELLAVVEAESAVDPRELSEWRMPLLHMQSDYSFAGMDVKTSDRTTQWLPDPQYETQVHYERKTPVLLASRPPIGPGIRLAPGESFASYRNFLLLFDSDERERQGLARRRMHRILAPWATENPIMMHVRRADRETFRAAVDQCAEVGFEMIIYTFGSGIEMENDDPAYLARVKEDADYAHAKGIEVGAYSLLASRSISPEHDAINPKTGKPGGAVFGNSPCLGSEWGQDYFRRIEKFIEATGLDLLEHDGSYPGDVCASISHPGHRGLEDSQWRQWRAITDFYQACRARGTYLNVPDTYFLAGSNKTGMGYRETNWSLPREQQIIHARQNIFDGTWDKTPSMGWMFVPLVEYQGGGAAATLEPLSEHLDAYEAHLAANFAAGVQACWRGPRLYDTDATRALVARYVAWFKKYRDILESDIIHVRRADGQEIDAILHVNPKLDRRALLAVFNPLDVPAERVLRVPLYYAGLSGPALVAERDENPSTHPLAPDASLELRVAVPARGFTWHVIRANK